MNCKIERKQAPGSIRLKGILGNALQKTVANRLKKVDYKELVDPFRFRNEDDGRWRCEFWGKIVRSTILAWQDTNDPELLEIIEATVKDLLSTQTADGCISSYPEDKQPNGWDIWGRKYVLAALLRYYEIVKQDEAILEACCRMVDHLEQQLGERPIVDFGFHSGLAASSILTHLVKLARYTGKPVGQKLIDTIISRGATYVHNVYHAAEDGVSPAEMGNGKSYEMSGCFEGLCEYLKECPDEHYRKSVLNYYKMVLSNEIYVTGTGGLKDGCGEFWFNGAKRQTWLRNTGSLGETCVTVAWLHFCSAVLEMTGDSRVADEMEKSFYNALLGAMHPDGHGWMHRNPTPLAGPSSRKTVGEQIKGFGGHDCCLAQGPEGISMIPQFSFRVIENGILINGYEAADCDFLTPAGKTGSLQIMGEYPCSGEIKLKLSLEEPEKFSVKLRIPTWSSKAEISAGGKVFTPESGEYFTLEQVWEKDSEISIRFDMNFRTVKDPGGSDLIAFCYGPLVLAQDSRLTEVGAAVKAGRADAVTTPEGFNFCWKIGETVLCDYASAGNGYSPENTLQVWLKEE